MTIDFLTLLYMVPSSHHNGVQEPRYTLISLYHHVLTHDLQMIVAWVRGKIVIAAHIPKNKNHNA